MSVREEIFVFLLIGLSVCISSNKCPPMEDIPHCKCYEEADGTLKMKCQGYHTGYTITDYRKILKENFAGKKNINLIFESFTKENRLPSKVFDGFDIKILKIMNCNVSKWADEEGGPAFVGLEDSLEELHIENSVLRPTHRRYERESAPMTFGHLHKLRELYFHGNKVYHFGNDWLRSGATSLEILVLDSNSIYEIGDQAFANLAHLKEINLNHNAILEVTRSMFPNPAKRLETIKLLGNKLRALPGDMFVKMPSLVRIDLQANEIRRLPESTWRPVWSRLHILEFEHNSLFCNDHINWMFKVKPPKHLFARCYNPRDMDNKSLMELIREKREQKE